MRSFTFFSWHGTVLLLHFFRIQIFFDDSRYICNKAFTWKNPTDLLERTATLNMVVTATETDVAVEDVRLRVFLWPMRANSETQRGVPEVLVVRKLGYKVPPKLLTY